MGDGEGEAEQGSCSGLSRTISVFSRIWVEFNALNMQSAINRCYPSFKLAIMLTSVWVTILTKGKVIF